MAGRRSFPLSSPTSLSPSLSLSLPSSLRLCPSPVLAFSDGTDPYHRPRAQSEDGSDAEEERAARRKHREALREDPTSKKDASAEAFSLAGAHAADKAARLRALPPWRRAVEAPDAQALAAAPDASLGAIPASAAPQPPLEEALSLAWVHGYRGHDCRTNLCFSAAGEAVYPAAAVVVLAGVAAEGGRRKQRFFTHHTDDVLCLAASPDRAFFASGQKALSAGRAAPRRSSSGMPRAGPCAPSWLACTSMQSRAWPSRGRPAAPLEWHGRSPQRSALGLAKGHPLTAEASPRPLLGLAFLRPRATAAMAAAEPPHPDVSREDVMPNGEGVGPLRCHRRRHRHPARNALSCAASAS